MSISSEDLLKAKELIIQKFAEATTYFCLYKTTASEDDDSICYSTANNLLNFWQDIISAIENNIFNYHPLKIAQLLLLFNFKNFDCPKTLYNKVLEELIIKRKDPTLQNSLEINDLDIEKNDWSKLQDYKKYITWAEVQVDVQYPIFRGFGFDVFEKDNVFYKEYYLQQGRFIFCADIVKKPRFLMTGHTLYGGVLENYRYKGMLPILPSPMEFKDGREKVKYEIDIILKHLGVNKSIAIDEINKITFEETSLHSNQDAVERIIRKASIPYSAHLKEMYL